MDNVLKLFKFTRGRSEAMPFPNETEQAYLSEYTFNANRMGGAPIIEGKIRHSLCLDKLWSIDVFVEFRGERYYVKYTPNSTKDTSSFMYNHDVQFLSEREVLDNIYFIDAVKNYDDNGDPIQNDAYKSNSTDVIFYGDIAELVRRLNASLSFAHIPYSVVIDEGITSEEKQVSFSDLTMSQAIQEIFNTFELGYYFVGQTCHVGFTENAITFPFKYGYDNALLSIRKENANFQIVNRCSGLGSSDNIPFYYPNESNDRKEIESKGGKWITPMKNLMPPIYRESFGEKRYYNAQNNTYPSPQVEGEFYTFENEYRANNPHEQIQSFDYIRPTIKGATNALNQRMDMFLDIAFDKNDNDDLNENNEYVHPYFYVKLARFDGKYGFNLFDHSIVDNTPMTLSMTSGVCGACNFEIVVDEETQKNVLQVDGNGDIMYDENGRAKIGKPQPKQNDTIQNEVWLILKKDVNTYGQPMPNAFQKLFPSVKDTFVILYIELPQAYILRAENELKEAIIKYMANNNSEKFTFSIDFSRIFFAEHPEILTQLNENSRVLVEYNNSQYPLYVSSFKYSVDNSNILPKISVELDEELNASGNTLRNRLDAVKQDIMNSIGSVDFLKQGLKYFLRKDIDDYARGYINFLKGIAARVVDANMVRSTDFIGGLLGNGFKLEYDATTGKSYLEVDEMYIRLRAIFNELQIKETTHVGGEVVLSPASMKCIKVKQIPMPNTPDNLLYRCYFKNNDGQKKIANQFEVGDQAYCKQFNLEKIGTTLGINRFYWRKVVNVGQDYIDLSDTDCKPNSNIPQEGDSIVTIGNEKDVERQNAIVLSSYGDGTPSIILYQGVNSYSFAKKDVIVISPKGNKFTGDFYLKTGESVSTKFEQTNELVGEISAKADRVELSVTNMQVGSTNYLLNSGQFVNRDNWNTIGNDGLIRIENKNLVFKITNGAVAWGHLSEQMSKSLVWEDGKEYTISVRLKMSKQRVFKLAFRDAFGHIYYEHEFVGKTNFNTYSYTFKYNAKNHVGENAISSFIIIPQVDIPQVGDETTIAYTMLQYGNRVGDWQPCFEDVENKVIKTGIDITDGKIILQANNTIFKSNDGKEVLAINGDGKLAVDVIDTNKLVAKIVKTAEQGKRVEISNNRLSMFDEYGNMKLLVSGEPLSTSQAGESFTINGATREYAKQVEPIWEKISLGKFNVKSSNNIVTIPIIDLGFSMNKQLDSNFSSFASIRLFVDDDRLIKEKECYGDPNEDIFANISSDEIQGTFGVGEHELYFVISANGQTDTFDLKTYAYPTSMLIDVVYTVDLIEIASNGFRSSSGGNNYLMQTSNGTEMRFGKFGFRINANGVQKMTNGTNWVDL